MDSQQQMLREMAVARGLLQRRPTPELTFAFTTLAAATAEA